VIEDAIMAEKFEEPRATVRLDEDSSDSDEPEIVVTKKKTSNSRIRWLETKLEDVDTENCN